MKILLLSPDIDASHDVLKALRDRGDAVLLAGSAIEAWQMLQLHGKSVDIAVVHREGASEEGEEGLDFINRFKADLQHSDLPYLLTTRFWSEEECAIHQNEAYGANAYLRSPFEALKIIETIDAIMGIDHQKSSPPPPPIKDSQNDVDEISIQLDVSDRTNAAVIPPTLDGKMSVPPPPPSAKEELSMAEMEAPVASLSKDPQVRESMPYLFGEAQKVRGEIKPLGDAIVPGGAAVAPDVETLKRYLSLREQDVASLTKELRAAKKQLEDLHVKLRDERSDVIVKNHQSRELEKEVRDLKKAHGIERKSFEKHLEDLEFKLRRKTDKTKVLELKVKDAQEDIEKVKERVRVDIRKIRVKEKELENKLEVLKKDSEILIQNRENRIIELKRRLDLVEFNLDLLQDQYAREKDRSKELDKRLAKASQAMRVAGGFLESDGETPLDESTTSDMKAS